MCPAVCPLLVRTPAQKGIPGEGHPHRRVRGSSGVSEAKPDAHEMVAEVGRVAGEPLADTRGRADLHPQQTRVPRPRVQRRGLRVDAIQEGFVPDQLLLANFNIAGPGQPLDSTVAVVSYPYS